MGNPLNYHLCHFMNILKVNTQFYFSTQKSAGIHMGEFSSTSSICENKPKAFMEKCHYNLLEELESQEFNQILAYLI